MTEEDLKKFLDDNAENIKETVRVKMVERLLAEHQWNISSHVSKTVDEFVAAEIVPEIKKYLADNKGPILKAALTGAAQIGDAMAQVIVERTAKKLKADSYEFREIMKALFT